MKNISKNPSLNNKLNLKKNKNKCKNIEKINLWLDVDKMFLKNQRFLALYKTFLTKYLGLWARQNIFLKSTSDWYLQYILKKSRYKVFSKNIHKIKQL